jgi:maltooligosyltrehalose trehalohydrolase
MGEEYGELAPFQFFSNHIDEEIAVATREGRRNEFAAFAEFGAESVPDPEAPGTFERSKLTRAQDPVIARLYTELIAARRRIGPAEAQDIAFDERGLWLALRRGGYQLLCNFGSGPLELACDGAHIELATHPDARLRDGSLTLPPMSGALIA